MIRVAFVIDTINAPTAGTEGQLLKLLRLLDGDRFKPVVCVLRTSDWLQKEFDVCPVKVLGIESFRKPAVIARIWGFRNFLLEQKIDIVQTFMKDGNIAGILGGVLARVPAILSSRRSQHYAGRDLQVLRALDTGVDAIVANSLNTKAWVLKNERVRESKIQIIYNGLDLSLYGQAGTASRMEYRRLLDLPLDAPTVGIVANLRSIKGHEVFLRAAERVARRVSNVRFVLVGEGDRSEPLRRLSVELGIAPLVTFLQRRTDVPEILSALDVGVLSSHSESLSNAIVEYLAAGLPVVCTDVGGARELVEDGVNGYVVPPGDPDAMADRLVDVLQGGSAARMASASRARAEASFSLARMVEEYESLYESYADGGRVRRIGRK